MSDIYVLQEFKRIKGNINSMREHAELLSSVRDDISEYKVRPTKLLDIVTINVFTENIRACLKLMPTPYLCLVQSSGTMSPKMQLLRERASIHGSIAHVSLNTIY